MERFNERSFTNKRRSSTRYMPYKRRSSCTPYYQPRFKTFFRFYSQPVVRHWARYQGTSQLIRQDTRPVIMAEVVFTLQQFLNMDQSRQIIKEKLNDWPLLENQRMALIDNALVGARDALRNTPLHRDFEYFDVPVPLYLHYFYDVAHIIDQGETRMVPALEWAIQSLEKKTLANEDGSCCTICMEDFFDGYEASFMPCSHAFHGECIEKWLRTSHYCPVCRFEMPTSPD